MGLSTERSGLETAGFRAALRNAVIALRSPPQYSTDIQALKKWTQQSVTQEIVFTRLVGDDPASAVQRPVWGPLWDASQQGSLLVTGEPGTGKSGVIYQLAQSLQQAGADVVLLPVDRLTVARRSELEQELRIQNDIMDVLENWEGGAPGYVIIDALDAARNFNTHNVFRDIVSVLSARDGRWHVIASVRKYDLRYGVEWRNLFAGAPPSTAYCDREFRNVRHIAILGLSRPDIEVIAQTRPLLRSFLDKAPPTVWDLLGTIFNLHLLVQLLQTTQSAQHLEAIRTQLDLLDTWWHYRVLGSDLRHDERETTVERVLECMIAARSLQVTRSVLRNTSGIALATVAELERQGVFRVSEADADSGSDQLQFAHHILFDYAVERLTFARGREPTRLISRLSKDRDLALVLRPSLDLACRDLLVSRPPALRFLGSLLYSCREHFGGRGGQTRCADDHCRAGA